MADTCYLCAVGSPRVTTQPGATSTQGFGTCTKCSVHACPQHGDRDPVYFRCVDCITGSAAQNVVQPSPDTQRLIADHGAYVLFAQAPVLALVAAPLFLVDLVHPMLVALRHLGPGAVEQARHRLEAELNELDTAQLAVALGLDSEEAASLTEQDHPEAGEVLWRTARVRIEMAFSSLEPLPDAHFDEAQASYALAALAVAFGARAAASLTDSVLAVPGGLYLPPLVILLSTVLVSELQL